MDSSTLHLISAKICANPSEDAWSQAYSAGNFFAVVSLSKTTETEDLFSPLGKNVLDKLEKEFFTLEEKNLDSIKSALKKAVEIIPKSINYSLIVAVIHSSTKILYVFIIGKGKILLKRADKIGTLLSSSLDKNGEIISASGLLENNDLIILETEKFSNIIPSTKLLSLTDHLSPSEIAESLMPLIYEAGESEAGSIIIRYLLKKKEEENLEEVQTISQPKMKFSIPVKMPHVKKMFFTICLILIIILVSSVFFAIKKQQEESVKSLFKNTYSKALQKYDEGQSLLSLNKNSAIDDFLEAQKILNEAKSKFKKDSKEYSQISDLQKKVDQGVMETSGVNLIQATAVDNTKSHLLKYLLDNPAFLLSQDDNYIYTINAKEISLIDKENQKVKKLVKNDNDWTTIKGFSNYYGNLYLLDPNKNQVFKFVKGEEGYGKANYFSNPPSLASAVSIAIDGSLWILLNDGKIQKFTKGNQDSFKNPTLDNPFKNPLKIFTDKDTDSLYILEPAMERIVVIGKDGSQQAQYKSNILKKASDFEVLEKDKLIYILADGKIYKIELK